mmetsp:Transcript_13568/g.17866  ORF Transcript_13568/g.17866 Transcript_13568/m.17866 type:complete len:113 (+) Transcript_13568:562-900(+)
MDPKTPAKPVVGEDSSNTDPKTPAEPVVEEAISAVDHSGVFFTPKETEKDTELEEEPSLAAKRAALDMGEMPGKVMSPGTMVATSLTAGQAVPLKAPSYDPDPELTQPKKGQ